MVEAPQGTLQVLSQHPVSTSRVHPVRDNAQLFAEQVAVPVQRHGGRGVPP
jgi:hypothetical protein